LIAPPGWFFALFDGSQERGLETYGTLAEVHGERQTPARALITRLEDAPAVVKKGNVFFLNGNPFAAFQAWLQGQENLHPWMAWKNRLFWLDEWVSFLGAVLFDVHALSPNVPRLGITGLRETTVVLKHDLDFSKSISYLLEEERKGVRSTNAVLKDRNTSFWLDTLKQYPNHEMAFHYNTCARNWIREAKRFVFRKGPGSIIPSVSQIAGKGLLKQVRWAKRKGIAIETLHRHAVFLIYPEWIDAIDEVLDSAPEVLGSNSLFRAHVLRWGVDAVDGHYGYLGEWPDSQFPLWYPFRISHAAMNGKILHGWESTCMMEIEPILLDQMLNHKIEELQQRIFVVNFHPCHGHQSTFHKSGSYNVFREFLSLVREKNIEVIPLCELYKLANASLAGLKS
jgi:hypothetical protein